MQQNLLLRQWNNKKKVKKKFYFSYKTITIFGFYREDQVSQLEERWIRAQIAYYSAKILSSHARSFFGDSAHRQSDSTSVEIAAEQFSMKCFTDEPHLWHNTSSKIDECTDSAAKGWVFSKRIGVFGDSIRLESIPVYSFQFILLKLRYTLSRTIIVSYYRDSRLPRFFLREPHPYTS